MEDNSFKITLKNAEGKKTYFAEPTGRIVRKATALKENLLTASLTPETLDEMAAFVVEMFENQFDADELYDGLGIGELGKTLLGYVDAVIARFFAKGERLPNAQTRTREK